MKLLTVKNFGPVEDANIIIKDFNLLIGEQSIGKSTLAKLITIFTDHLFMLAMFVEQTETWHRYLDNFDLSVYADGDYDIAYTEQYGNVKISIKVSPMSLSCQIYENEQQLANFSDVFRIISSSKILFHSEALDKLQGLQENEFRTALYKLMRNSLYIPAERTIASQLNNFLPAITIAKEQLPNNLLMFMQELSNAKTYFTNLQIDLLNIKYNRINNEDYFEIGSGQPLPLRLASSGIQSAVPLILLVEYVLKNREYASYVVEEPECNLFPQKQVELLRYLINNVYNDSRMLTITTHSPYLLSALNNYLFAGSIEADLNEENKKEMENIIPKELWLHADNCTVCSLGENINGGEYFKNLIDGETGLIDYNYLDGVSINMSEEFDRLQNLYLKANND